MSREVSSHLPVIVARENDLLAVSLEPHSIALVLQMHELDPVHVALRVESELLGDGLLALFFNACSEVVLDLSLHDLAGPPLKGRINVLVQS